MPIKNLPSNLIGKTIIQIRDLHVCNQIDQSYLFNSLIKTKEYKPSFVVYTGDFISYENEKQFEQLDEELKHSVKGEFATLGILGSHDYGENWSDQVVTDKVKNILDYNKFCY